MSTRRTEDFYDEFWPGNIPDHEQTRKYMLGTITGRSYSHALDAGCGHGICSVVLSEISQQVLAVDISPKCVTTAREQAARFGRTNVTVMLQDLQEFEGKSDHFDLVWCWGVAMMAPNPEKVMHHLFRVTRPGGELYLGLYLKTALSPLHEAVRHFCRKYMSTKRRKQWILNGFTRLTRIITWLRGQEINLRADNVSIQVQVDDWFYPPYKKFYSIEEILNLFNAHGFNATCIQNRLGRMRSATIFVVRGVKK